MARVITQLSAGAACAPLEAFRANQPVSNSRGVLRHDTAGGAARRLFCGLPSVGPAVAKE